MNGYTPESGDLVWDEAVRRLGEVMDRVGARWQLRLPGGGREWDASGPLRPATAAERLSADVALANARSQGEARLRSEDGNGGLRRTQVIVSGTEFTRRQTAYQEYIEHAEACPECVHGVCLEVRRLWRIVKGREQ